MGESSESKEAESRRLRTLPLSAPQGLLQREKGPDLNSLDQLLKQKNLPDSQQDAFKTGFTEGFMRSQAFTQKTQGECRRRFSSPGPFGRHTEPQMNLNLCSMSTDSLRRTRFFVLALLLLGLYGLSRTPFLSGKGSFSDAGLFQFYSSSACPVTHCCACTLRVSVCLLCVTSPVYMHDRSAVSYRVAAT